MDQEKHQKLVRHLFEEKQLPRITEAITKAIDQSFSVALAKLSRSAVEERFEICIKIIEELRVGYKWSLPRILDKLPLYLTYRLFSIPYDPAASGERGWTESTAADALRGQ